jgi:hypothetical protein
MQMHMQISSDEISLATMTNCGGHTVLLEELQIGGRELCLATAELSMAKEGLGLCRGRSVNDERFF